MKKTQKMMKKRKNTMTIVAATKHGPRRRRITKARSWKSTLSEVLGQQPPFPNVTFRACLVRGSTKTVTRKASILQRECSFPKHKESWKLVFFFPQSFGSARGFSKTENPKLRTWRGVLLALGGQGVPKQVLHVSKYCAPIGAGAHWGGGLCSHSVANCAWRATTSMALPTT